MRSFRFDVPLKAACALTMAAVSASVGAQSGYFGAARVNINPAAAKAHGSGRP